MSVASTVDSHRTCAVLDYMCHSNSNSHTVIWVSIHSYHDTINVDVVINNFNIFIMTADGIRTMKQFLLASTLALLCQQQSAHGQQAGTTLVQGGEVIHALALSLATPISLA